MRRRDLLEQRKAVLRHDRHLRPDGEGINDEHNQTDEQLNNGGLEAISRHNENKGDGGQTKRGPANQANEMINTT